MNTHLKSQSRSGAGYWATVILAVFIIVFGLPLFGGGAYLAWLGGSLYYLFAGLGLLLTAWFLIKASMTALWVYLLTYGGTLVWAFWEKGFDWWAQVPRLVAPTVILVLVLATLPVLRSRSRPKYTSERNRWGRDERDDRDVSSSNAATTTNRDTVTLIPSAS